MQKKYFLIKKKSARRSRSQREWARRRRAFARAKELDQAFLQRIELDST